MEVLASARRDRDRDLYFSGVDSSIAPPDGGPPPSDQDASAGSADAVDVSLLPDDGSVPMQPGPKNSSKVRPKTTIDQGRVFDPARGRTEPIPFAQGNASAGRRKLHAYGVNWLGSFSARDASYHGGWYVHRLHTLHFACCRHACACATFLCSHAHSLIVHHLQGHASRRQHMRRSRPGYACHEQRGRARLQRIHHGHAEDVFPQNPGGVKPGPVRPCVPLRRRETALGDCRACARFEPIHTYQPRVRDHKHDVICNEHLALAMVRDEADVRRW